MFSDKAKDIIVILIALLGGIKFRILGTFYASEILIYLMLFKVDWLDIKSNRYAWNLYKLSWVWLVSAIVTDLWIGTDLINLLKGEFNIIFFMLQFPVIYWLLYDKPIRFLYFLVSSAIVSLPNLYLFGPDIDESNYGLMGENIWFYYSLVPIAIGIISLLYFKGKISIKTTCFLMVGFGFWMLFHNSRNIFLSMSIAAVLLYQCSKIGDSDFSLVVERYQSSIGKLFLWIMIGGLSVNVIYENLARTGTLGQYAYKKYIMQSQADNILKGGRIETFIGAWLVMKSPIIGYGSYSIDKNNYYHIQYGKEHGIAFKSLPWDKRMPAHSHIIGAWMWNGIGGGIFWIYVLWLIWKIFKSGAFLTQAKLLPGILMTLTSKIWEIIFSPFGLRIPVSVFLMFLTILYVNFENAKIPQHRNAE